MNKTNEKYVFKYWYEYGGCCIWSVNEAAQERYGVGGVNNNKFPISEELKNELYRLEDKYQSSLNWDYPPDPSPWTKEQWNDFRKKATKAYHKLCEELGSEYEITNDLDSCLHYNLAEQDICGDIEEIRKGFEEFISEY